MKQLKKKDLIIGEIYSVVNQTNSLCVFKHKYTDNDVPAIEYYAFVSEDRNYFKKDNIHYVFKNLKLATPEEKHWLNEAIKLDKFITHEEAMKTFIPEYVECTQEQYRSSYKVGIIYKLKNTLIENEIGGMAYWTYNQHRFKPSTKEAYDAQFVVKEPEFVLPEKWYIILNSENRETLNKWRKTDSELYNDCDYECIKYDKYGTSLNHINKYLQSCQEITFKQFKKYILKEEVIEKKVIEPLPQFKIIETIETITKVENNEGNQFFIGDTVIGSKTKIKSKIISFKYNVDKTAILAITDKTSNIGIGINHLEHYIEPKVEVEETLLEKAKRLYPVGTKFINPNGNKECVIKEKGDYFKGNNNNIYHSLKSGIYKYEEGLSGCIYMNNTWSKIIE